MQRLWSWLGAIALLPLHLALAIPMASAQGVDPFRELENFEHWANLCRLLAEAEAFEDAIGACDEAVLLNPRDPSIWSDRRFGPWNLGRFAEAIASADEAIALRAEFSEAYTWRCTAFSGLERDEDAVDACEQALLLDSHWRRNSNPAEAWYRRGAAMLRLDQREAAAIAYDRALLVMPEDSQFLARKCEVLIQLEQPLAAIAACDAALASNQNWRDDTTESLAWRNRAAALQQVGGEEQAIAALAPDAFLAWYSQAKAAASLGNFSLAAPAYERALAIEPDNADTWAEYGIALQRLGQSDTAQNAFAQALRINPAQALALENQEYEALARLPSHCRSVTGNSPPKRG